MLKRKSYKWTIRLEAHVERTGYEKDEKYFG